MTLNGFLIAGAAALLASRDDLTQGSTSAVTSWSWTITVVATVGLISNLSILYSNYWADRAIQSADAAFMNVLTDTLDGARCANICGWRAVTQQHAEASGWGLATRSLLQPDREDSAPVVLASGCVLAGAVRFACVGDRGARGVLVKVRRASPRADGDGGNHGGHASTRESVQSDARLRDAVRDRVHQVDQRVVRGGNAYAEERDEIRRRRAPRSSN